MEPQFCRVCLNKAATVSLFSKKDDNIQYCTKLMRCANVEVSDEDVLPSHICDSCISELDVTYNFIEKCEISEKALRCIASSKEFGENEVKSEIKEETGDHDGIDNDYLLDPASNSNNDVEIKQKHNKRKYRKKNTEKKPKEKVKQGKSGHIQCTICGLMVISASAMQVHIRTHTGEKPFACPFCDHCYMSKGALKRHTETFHTKRERKFTCETCGCSFYRKNDIITHMRRHTGERPYSCPFCPKSFLQIASLIRHKRIHTGDKPFACGICDKRFTDRTLAKKHLLVHTDEKNFTCQLCNKAMKSKCSLRTHIAAVHSNEKHNVCSFCGMSFSMKGNLKTHIGRMHSEKSGECNVCLKTFSDLDVHMRKHTGEKPFVCDTCNKAFGTKRSLANHMVFKHENTGKYKCSVGDCAKTFPVGTMLEFHLLKHHTNHTPYICQHCSRGFYRTSDLSRHLRVSHMDFSLKEPLKSISTSA